MNTPPTAIRVEMRLHLAHPDSRSRDGFALADWASAAYEGRKKFGQVRGQHAYQSARRICTREADCPFCGNHATELTSVRYSGALDLAKLVIQPGPGRKAAQS